MLMMMMTVLMLMMTMVVAMMMKVMMRMITVLMMNFRMMVTQRAGKVLDHYLIKAIFKTRRSKREILHAYHVCCKL